MVNRNSTCSCPSLTRNWLTSDGCADRQDKPIANAPTMSQNFFMKRTCPHYSLLIHMGDTQTNSLLVCSPRM